MAFCFVSIIVMPLSISKAADKAREIDTQIATTRQQQGSSPLSSTGQLQALNVTLVFYTLCVFYLGALFAAFIVYGVLNVVHAAMDAYFRNSMINSVLAARATNIMERANAYLDPGNVLAFLSIRYWPAHLLVFACTMLAAILHSLLLGSRTTTGDRNKSKNDQQSTTVYTNYRRTVLTTTQSAFWTLYAAVVVREMMCVASANQT